MTSRVLRVPHPTPNPNPNTGGHQPDARLSPYAHRPVPHHDPHDAARHLPHPPRPVGVNPQAKRAAQAPTCPAPVPQLAAPRAWAEPTWLFLGPSNLIA
eukprot:scaffold89261_cov61-Phaeocystis_antarctica.AAC.7